MARIYVTDRVRNGFNVLALLTNEEFATFVDASVHATPRLTMSGFREEVRAALPQYTAEQVEDLVFAILGLQNSADDEGLSKSEFTERVMDGLYAPETQHPVLSQDQLRQRLETVLALDPVWLSSRAAAIQSENQRIYLNARVVTDLRPLFSDAEVPIAMAAVVVHSLVMKYLEDDEEREFHIALDPADVRSLAGVLSRASIKHEQLAPILSSELFPFHEVEP